jgi:murein DD-endopeptidase
MRALLTSALALLLTGAVACSSPPRSPGAAGAPVDASARLAAARTAERMIGTPYRRRGASPTGFDCSGLVVYSYAEAGIPGLPRTAPSLERVARPVALGELEPGDLLFFRLSGPKTSHVAIYLGDRSFVHAPSSGKRVERVSFDHVYWSEHLRRAGRVDR